MFTLTLICMNALKLASQNVEKLVSVCVWGGGQDLPLDLAAAGAGSQIRRGATWERVSA